MGNGTQKKDSLKNIRNKMGELGNEIHTLDIEDVFLKEAKRGLLEGLYAMQNAFNKAQQIFGVHED